LGADGADVGLKAEVQHAVGLVKHQVGDVLQAAAVWKERRDKDRAMSVQGGTENLCDSRNLKV
jgi:hypothetical protein